MFRNKFKVLYEKRLNRKLDKLHAYSARGKTAKVIWVSGLPRFNVSPAESMEYYWDLLGLKPDIMETFDFNHLIQTTIVSIIMILIGAATWIF
jgi:hypothetical protein